MCTTPQIMYLGDQAVGVPRPRARIRGGSRRCLQMSLSDLVRKNVPAASKIEAVASPEDSTKHPEDHRRRPWKRPQQSLTAFEGNDAGESPRQAHVSLWLRGCAARHVRTRWKGGLFGPFTGVPSPAPIQTKRPRFRPHGGIMSLQRIAQGFARRSEAWGVS